MSQSSSSLSSPSLSLPLSRSDRMTQSKNTVQSLSEYEETVSTIDQQRERILPSAEYYSNSPPLFPCPHYISGCKVKFASFASSAYVLHMNYHEKNKYYHKEKMGQNEGRIVKNNKNKIPNDILLSSCCFTSTHIPLHSIPLNDKNSLSLSLSDQNHIILFDPCECLQCEAKEEGEEEERDKETETSNDDQREREGEEEEKDDGSKTKLQMEVFSPLSSSSTPSSPLPLPLPSSPYLSPSPSPNLSKREDFIRSLMNFYPHPLLHHRIPYKHKREHHDEDDVDSDIGHHNDENTKFKIPKIIPNNKQIVRQGKAQIRIIEDETSEEYEGNVNYNDEFSPLHPHQLTFYFNPFLFQSISVTNDDDNDNDNHTNNQILSERNGEDEDSSDDNDNYHGDVDVNMNIVPRLTFDSALFTFIKEK